MKVNFWLLYGYYLVIGTECVHEYRKNLAHSYTHITMANDSI